MSNLTKILPAIIFTFVLGACGRTVSVVHVDFKGISPPPKYALLGSAGYFDTPPDRGALTVNDDATLIIRNVPDRFRLELFDTPIAPSSAWPSDFFAFATVGVSDLSPGQSKEVNLYSEVVSTDGTSKSYTLMLIGKFRVFLPPSSTAESR